MWEVRQESRQAPGWQGDVATACQEIQRERTGASEQEQQGAALRVWERLWRSPLLLQVSGSTTLESLPRGHSWRFRAGLFDFLSLHLHSYLGSIFCYSLGGLCPFQTLLFGVTLQEKEHWHNLSHKCFPLHSKAVYSDLAFSILPCNSTSSLLWDHFFSINGTAINTIFFHGKYFVQVVFRVSPNHCSIIEPSWKHTINFHWTIDHTRSSLARYTEYQESTSKQLEWAMVFPMPYKERNLENNI